MLRSFIFFGSFLAIKKNSTQIHSRRFNQKGDEKMDVKIFNSLSTYEKTYFYLASGSKTREEVLKYLKDSGMSKTTAGDHVKKAAEGKLPYISCEDEKLILDKAGIELLIKELSAKFQYEAILEPKRKKRLKAGEEYGGAVTSGHSQGYQEMKAKADSAKAMEKELRDLINQKDEQIKDLQRQLSEKIDDAVINGMRSKVLVIGSAKVKPEEKFQRDFFLDNPGRLLDVEELVSKYGGRIDSPYEPMFSVEKKLTSDNYLKKLGKMLFKGRLLSSRLEEQDKFSDVNSSSHSNANWVQRDSVNLVDIEKNRLTSINEILAMDGVTNQMKLSLYAAWFNGVDPEMVELLNYAGELDINANYVIRLLEKPKEYRNYRTIRGLLKQAKMASEAHIKREAALELISGEWYVEAIYRGKPCKFQMMPIDELQAFKDFLLKHQTENAIGALDAMLCEQRVAEFADDDVDGTIIVTAESENNEQANMDIQIAPPNFLHDKETESGVNCHPKINDDDAYEGFSEAEQKGENDGKE